MTREVSVSRDFKQGFWYYIGPGSEKSWKYDTLLDENNPTWRWDDTALKMNDILASASSI